MPRRRSHRVSFVPLVVAVVLAVAIYFSWRHRDAWWPEPAATPTAAAPFAGAALDACTLAPLARIEAALGAKGTSLRRVGAEADVPAAGACTYEFERAGRRGSLVVLAFTRESLARGVGEALAPREYYASTVTGLEYALKAVPSPITGLGDEAAIAGFEPGGEGQLVVRSGDTVLQLVARELDRAAVERAARELVVAR